MSDVLSPLKQVRLKLDDALECREWAWQLATGDISIAFTERWCQSGYTSSGCYCIATITITGRRIYSIAYIYCSSFKQQTTFYFNPFVMACDRLWSPVIACDRLWSPVIACDRLWSPVIAIGSCAKIQKNGDENRRTQVDDGSEFKLMLSLWASSSVAFSIRMWCRVNMFRAIWKPRAVCRLHGAVCRLHGGCRLHAMQSADCARAVHARVCFGEITSKKTERIVMIL